MLGITRNWEVTGINLQVQASPPPPFLLCTHTHTQAYAHTHKHIHTLTLTHTHYLVMIIVTQYWVGWQVNFLVTVTSLHWTAGNNNKENCHCTTQEKTINITHTHTHTYVIYTQSPTHRQAYICCCWSLLQSASLRSQADSLHSHVILHEWIAFYSTFLTIHWSGVLTVLAWLVPHDTATISACSVYTIQPCTMSLHAKPHMFRFSCNLPPALLAELPWSFTCYCGNTGVERIPK